MELYKIKHLEQIYYFTSSKDDIEVNGIIYKAIPISRQEITRSLDDNGLKITAPTNIEPFNLMFLQTLSDLSSIEIVKYPEMLTLYKGRIVKAEVSFEKEITTLSVGQKIILGQNEFPIRSYSQTCGYNFCDEYCGLQRVDFKVTLTSGEFTINDTGNVITAASIGSIPYINGGYIIANSRYYSFIIDYSAGSITLLNALPNPLSISKIEVFPSCNKTLEACAHYNNLNHFGGFPYIPNNNITTGGF